MNVPGPLAPAGAFAPTTTSSSFNGRLAGASQQIEDGAQVAVIARRAWAGARVACASCADRTTPPCSRGCPYRAGPCTCPTWRSCWAARWLASLFSFENLSLLVYFALRLITPVTVGRAACLRECLRVFMRVRSHCCDGSPPRALSFLCNSVFRSCCGCAWSF